MNAGISVRGLAVHYVSRAGVIPAVDGVDLDIAPGERVGLVGESGSGKSTLGRAIVRLVDDKRCRIVSGSVHLNGIDVLGLSRRELDRIRGAEIGVVFQNPQTALNPVLRIGDQVAEPLRTHTLMTKDEIMSRVLRLLRHVGIADVDHRVRQFPHELSGGMQQRAAIAMALACSPRFLIADEPTTALDVTVQAHILQLIARLSDESAMGVLFISHNIGVVAQICTKTLVMYGGVIVEAGPTAKLFRHPVHPYTKGLLQSIPSLERPTDRLFSIPGSVGVLQPSAAYCRFVDRCPYAIDRCRDEVPELADVSGRLVRCFRAAELEDDRVAV